MKALWVGEQRRALAEVRKRLSQGAAILNADHRQITGTDDLGEWIYSPPGGLHPVEYYNLRPVLDGPIELDAVCRGVLESRLILTSPRELNVTRWHDTG